MSLIIHLVPAVEWLLWDQRARLGLMASLGRRAHQGRLGRPVCQDRQGHPGMESCRSFTHEHRRHRSVRVDGGGGERGVFMENWDGEGEDREDGGQET